MTVSAWRSRLAAAMLLAVSFVSAPLASSAQAEGLAALPQYDLFYNYYAGGGAAGIPVGMYPSPQPVPARVGGTYLTYQPFYPQEFMYPHARTYRRFQRGQLVPMNTTRAVYW